MTYLNVILFDRRPIWQRAIETFGLQSTLYTVMTFLSVIMFGGRRTYLHGTENFWIEPYLLHRYDIFECFIIYKVMKYRELLMK